MTELCTVASEGRGEALTATASRVDRWLLVEHRGAWGPQSVPTSRMSQNAARALAKQAADAGARLLLIRRPAGSAQREGRTVYAVDSRPGHERVLTRHVTEDAELVALDVVFDSHGAAGAVPTGWEAYEGPLYLVCTHGRHDRCCALRGRPVAKALAAAHSTRVWECTHVGGDRFAANIIVLPEGLYLGRVDAADAVAMADALAAGTLPAGHVRGRSSLPLPTQAAQQLAREATGRWGTDDLAPAGQQVVGTDTWQVLLVGPGGPDVEVTVRYDRVGDGGRHLLTCDGPDDKVVPLFRLVSLQARAGDLVRT